MLRDFTDASENKCFCVCIWIFMFLSSISKKKKWHQFNAFSFILARFRECEKVVSKTRTCIHISDVFSTKRAKRNTER